LISVAIMIMIVIINITFFLFLNLISRLIPLFNLYLSFFKFEGIYLSYIYVCMCISVRI
jgi:hypothetical protein